MAEYVDIEYVRFRYEVAREPAITICRDLQIKQEDLAALIKQENWQQHALPGQEASEDEVNLFYKQGRQRLTVELTRRAIQVFPQLVRIENEIFNKVTELTSSFDTKSENAPADIARVVNAYTKMLDRQLLMREAIDAPALSDKKLENLFSAELLTSVLDKLDGKGRKLPSTD